MNLYSSLMNLGIISDTHDDIENVQKAINLFIEEKVEIVIHAGDYIFPGIVQEFGRLVNDHHVRFIRILGNNDGERDGLLKTFIDIGGELKGDFTELTDPDGMTFAIYHGKDDKLKDRLRDSGKYDVLICGH
jgi:putative phosphoesterase